MNITDEYDTFINCTDNENDDIKIIIKSLILSIPGNVLFLSLIGLVIWKIIEHLFTYKW